MSLYIRHGPKQYNNGKSDTYPLDPGLTEDGKLLAEIQFREYLTTYGAPKTIRTSPYLRARETAEIAQNVIQDTLSISVPIVVDRWMGEYLGHQKQRMHSDSFHPETYQHRPIPPENFGQFKRRVKQWMHKTAAPDCWYVTHGLFIREVASTLGFKMGTPIELHGMRVHEHEVTVL
jgi:broad specificity phosphatase PhoE